MEVQLQELIDRIKKDGVDEAQAQAAAIIAAANEKAEKIVADARAEADKLIISAKAENDRVVASGEAAISQAARNTLISFRDSVTRELNAILAESINGALVGDELTGLILKAVEQWLNKPEAEDLTVILNTEDLSKLQGSLTTALKERFSKGVTLKASDSFDGGFRISVNDGGAYYDYSSEAVLEMMSCYLSPKITELLKEA